MQVCSAGHRIFPAPYYRILLRSIFSNMVLIKTMIVINYRYSSKLEGLCATQEAKNKINKKEEANLLPYEIF